MFHLNHKHISLCSHHLAADLLLQVGSRSFTSVGVVTPLFPTFPLTQGAETVLEEIESSWFYGAFAVFNSENVSSLKKPGPLNPQSPDLWEWETQILKKGHLSDDGKQSNFCYQPFFLKSI